MDDAGGPLSTLSRANVSAELRAVVRYKHFLFVWLFRPQTESGKSPLKGLIHYDITVRKSSASYQRSVGRHYLFAGKARLGTNIHGIIILDSTSITFVEFLMRY